MNFKKTITYYLIIEILAIIIAYFLLIKQSSYFANYIGMVTAISCAVGFGLAFYLIFLLLKKKITINKFMIYFLLSLFGVVVPYLFMTWIVSQLH
jgi:hypothetical protein